MCGRYVLRHPTQELLDYFRLSDFADQFLPGFNIAPTQRIPVVYRDEENGVAVRSVRWGLIPSWSQPGQKLPLMINARCETIASKPVYRSAFANRRCIIPASGYYEWQKLPNGVKQPYYIFRKDGCPMAFAGIWESKTDGDDTTFSSALVTTVAGPETEKIHDRMPVLLREDEWDAWLGAEKLSESAREALFTPERPFS